MNARPTCGRPTNSGEACRAVVHYSAALREHAPACRKHMTDAELGGIDADPLWTLEGQIRWYLDQRADSGLVQASEIAAELDALVADVSAALQKLENDAAISSPQIGRRRLWGSYAQMQRLLDDEQQARRDEADRIQRIVDGNAELDAIQAELSEVLSHRGIDVTSVRRLLPSQAADSRPDQLVLLTSDLVSASWLLAKLRESPAAGDSSPVNIGRRL
jgi:hypothetical protein